MLPARSAHSPAVLSQSARVCSVTSGVRDSVDRSPSDSCPWDSPGKSAGMGCRALLPGSPAPRAGAHSQVRLPHSTVRDPYTESPGKAFRVSMSLPNR